MELHADEPRVNVARQLDHLGQLLALRDGRDDQTGLLQGVEVVLVDIWEGTEPRPEVERFCEMWGIKGPLLLDPDETLARELGVRGVPTNVVVDSDGIVREFGAARLDELEQAIESLHAHIQTQA